MKDKVIVKESISTWRMNGKAARGSNIVSEMVKTAGEAGVDMIANLISQITLGVSPAEWELGTIVDHYKRKGGTLERGNYRGLKLTDQILKIDERVHKTTGGHGWDTVWLHARMQNYKPHYYFEAVAREILRKKEEFVLCICRFGKSFWSSA